LFLNEKASWFFKLLILNMKPLYCTILLLILFSPLLAQAPDLKFEKIDVMQGLSQSTVTCILQDKTGFLWFGTIDGLNKYDGYKFTVFKAIPDDPDAISDNYIYGLLQDTAGLIWVGTRDGLNYYDPVTEKFTRYEHNPADKSSLPDNTINSLCESKNGDIWIATYNGLARFNRKSGDFRNYYNEEKNPGSLPGNIVYSIYQDRSGILWIGTSAGLAKYNPGDDSFITVSSSAISSVKLANNSVRAITEDRKGNLWVGTEKGLNKINKDRSSVVHYQVNPENPLDPRSLTAFGIFTVFNDKEDNVWIGLWNGGLLLYNDKADIFYRYLSNTQDPFSISYNTVSNIAQDNAGIIWIATWGGGLNKYDRNKEKFKCYQNRTSDPKGLSSNYITSIFRDKDGFIWLGTWGGGLNRFDRTRNIFKVYMPDQANPHAVSEDVYAILQDRNGILWFGTRAGLDRFDPVTGRFYNYGGPKDPIKRFNNTVVRTLSETADGRIWIGTDAGLYEFDYRKGNYILYRCNSEDTTTLSNDRIRKIYLSHTGDLWVGTANGLNKMDLKTRTFTRYLRKTDTENSLSNNYVWSVCEDSEGILWIGTNGGGLNRFDPKSGLFKVYNEKQGLPNDGIYGVLVDRNNFIWVSTNKGLSCFDPANESFKNYEVNDGLQGFAFNGGSYFLGNDGEMFFGGYNGFNSFIPDSVRDNRYIPPVIITDFQIFNKKVSIGGRSPLKESISLTKEIHLSWRDYIFSLEFASLHYSSPQDNMYMYKLEGVDKDWVTTNSSRRFVSYTNLEPGKYLLRVKGTNSDDMWNPLETRLLITVSPPYWKTWWFRIIMLAFISASIYGIFRWRVEALRNNQRILEKKVREKTAELINKREELEKTLYDLQHTQKQLIQSEKMASLGVLSAGVGHEINNPLNFIKGGTSVLMSILTNKNDLLAKEIEPSIDIINEGVNRISRIVKSLSHYSRSGEEMDENCDIHEIIEHCLVILENQLKNKAEIIKDYTSSSVSVSGNDGKLHQVFLNILSNAGQAIMERGQITIKTVADHEYVRIFVLDTGCGISDENLQKIFDPFFTTKAPGEGTGLGLSIAYKIIEEHKGLIEINSILNNGTEVIVTLPKL
jgi:ligand-binding sensor domain-containing protein/signal transduction histidine kinase